MSLTITQARDEMLAPLKTAWDAGANGAPLKYDDVPGTAPTSGSWGRVSVRHFSGEQATLANNEGVRRWRNAGIIFVQLFAEAGSGFGALDALVEVVKNAYQGKDTPGGAWFRNVRVNEVGRDGPWEQVNVLIDFEYDQVK